MCFTAENKGSIALEVSLDQTVGIYSYSAGNKLYCLKWNDYTSGPLVSYCINAQHYEDCLASVLHTVNLGNLFLVALNNEE